VNYRSYAGRAVFELPLGQYDVYVGGEARKYTYPTRAGTVIGIGPHSGSVLALARLAIS